MPLYETCIGIIPPHSYLLSISTYELHLSSSVTHLLSIVTLNLTIKQTPSFLHAVFCETCRGRIPPHSLPSFQPPRLLLDLSATTDERKRDSIESHTDFSDSHHHHHHLLQKERSTDLVDESQKRASKEGRK